MTAHTASVEGGFQASSPLPALGIWPDTVTNDQPHILGAVSGLTGQGESAPGLQGLLSGHLPCGCLPAPSGRKALHSHLSQERRAVKRRRPSLTPARALRDLGPRQVQCPRFRKEISSESVLQKMETTP
jgi:hypothetical protein